MTDLKTRQRAAQFLGVAVDVEPVELKRLYRQLAKEWHPDRQGGDEARFGQLSWAYSVLMQPMPTAAGTVPGWSAGPAAAADDAWTEPIPVVTPEMARPEAVPTVNVQRGVMTWVRTHLRVRLVVQALLAAAALVLVMAQTGLAWWSLGFAVPLALVLVARSVWLALGRPQVPWFDRDRKRGPRRPKGPDDTPTGPIPVITPEMLQQQR